MDFDRNLRFGVLAVDEGLITAEQFSQACGQWSRRGGGSLAELLVENGWLRSLERERLEAQLDRPPAASPAATQAFFNDSEPADPFRTQDVAGVTVDVSRAGANDGTGDPVVVLQEETRFEVDSLHAEGGIGRIWLARDCQLNRLVALKTLRPELHGYSRVRARFLQEAQITGQLEHPGIIPVYEVTQHAGLGQVSYAMRFVRGKTLVQASTEYHQARRDGNADPLGLVALLSAFVAVCNTVAYAHSRGVIHRDLKGENILLGDFGEVIVLDWGVAKVIGRSTEAAGSEPPIEWLNAEVDQTLQGDVVGTPAYMAPEQADGRADLVDNRTDIYGLGAILYEILTGQPPFSGANTIDVLHKVLRAEPARPRELWPDVPATLEAICLRALSKDAAGRFGSASELAEQVQIWQEVQRREAEDALRRQSEILKSILDNMVESVVVVDRAGRPLVVNPAAELMLAVNAADEHWQASLARCQFYLADQTTPCPAERLPLNCALRQEEVQDAEFFVRADDRETGRWLSVSARPLVGAHGTTTGALMVLRDITDRKLAEEELRRSRERFELAVRGSQDGLWDWDLQTNEVFFSPRWKSILGYEDHELANHLDEWDRRLHPEERDRVLAANYAHINGSTSHYEYEYRLRHKNGEFRWILARGVALRDGAGKAYRMAGSHVDITDWKQLEQRLRECEERCRALAANREGDVR